MMFHDCFKVSSSMFCLFFKAVWIISMGFSWMLQGCSKSIFKKLQGYLRSVLTVLERKFKRSSKGVSMFQGNFNNVSKLFQNSLKGVSRKFCFLILYTTHRSYPSSRRACFFMPQGPRYWHFPPRQYDILHFLCTKRWNGHISAPWSQIKRIRTLSFL